MCAWCVRFGHDISASVRQWLLPFVSGRCPEDDQWVNTHNLYVAMFSPSTIQIVPFDPEHGPDTARQYAGKYASKPEKWYMGNVCASIPRARVQSTAAA